MSNVDNGIARRGLMLVLSSPSGAGKSTIARNLLRDDPDNARPLFDLNGVDADTVYLNPAPLYHAAPLRWTLGVLRRGGQVINMGRFDAQACLDLVAAHRVTHIQFVPTMMIRLLKLPEAVRAAADSSACSRSSALWVSSSVARSSPSSASSVCTCVISRFCWKVAV